MLGAGGLAGQAYQAGVLTALEDHLGWDPRSADVLVGTSAGAVTSSLLRLRVSASDLAAWAVHAPLSVQGSLVARRMGGDARQFPPLALTTFLRIPRPPQLSLINRMLTQPCRVTPEAIAASMMAAGKIDICSRVHRLDGLFGDKWPSGLLVCACRRDDGRRTVFGREGRPEVNLADAVAASCAIPGYMKPVDIAGISYIDGGVHSTTNADAIHGHKLDVAVIVAPMSAAHGRAFTIDGLWRLRVHRQIEGELPRLRKEGTEIVRIEPGSRVLNAMGLNPMDDSRSARVIDAAYEETMARLKTEPVSKRLAGLGQRQAAIRQVRREGRRAAGA